MIDSLMLGQSRLDFMRKLSAQARRAEDKKFLADALAEKSSWRRSTFTFQGLTKRTYRRLYGSLVGLFEPANA